MHGKAALGFPALDGALGAAEEGSNFLPGVKALPGERFAIS
jgi:hypothetical protein